MLKPYSQNGLTPEKRIFNYCLSRARRVVENAFGILANRFRVFLTPINLAPEKVEIIITLSLLYSAQFSSLEGGGTVVLHATRKCGHRGC